LTLPPPRRSIAGGERLMLHEERRGATAILTLDFPERRNALGMPMRERLVAAFERLEADAALRAIVLTGAGGQFSAGGDIAGMNAADLAAGRERFRTTHRLVRLMVKSAKPIIAAVEGHAVGAGLSLALCCDTIIAAADARFASSFGRVGLIADLGLLHTLPARVGQGRAREMFLYGETVTAPDAERIGLIDRMVPNGAALEAALARAAAFETTAPLPVALTKSYLARGLDAALDWEREVQSALFLSADHAEGKAAFLAKRAPRFAGR
jgi:enoyl-CoA hydratase/carnithine racemase